MKAFTKKDGMTICLELDRHFSITIAHTENAQRFGHCPESIHAVFGTQYDLFCKLHLANELGLPFGDASNAWWWYGGKPAEQAASPVHFANVMRISITEAEELIAQQMPMTEFMRWFWSPQIQTRFRDEALYCINQISELEATSQAVEAAYTELALAEDLACTVCFHCCAEPPDITPMHGPNAWTIVPNAKYGYVHLCPICNGNAELSDVEDENGPPVKLTFENMERISVRLAELLTGCDNAIISSYLESLQYCLNPRNLQEYKKLLVGLTEYAKETNSNLNWLHELEV